MLLKNIIVIENFTCNIVFSEANLSLGLVNILQNYIAEMVRWYLKTWITDCKRVQENFHSLKKKKKKTQNESICRLSSNTSVYTTWDFRIKEK